MRVEVTPTCSAKADKAKAAKAAKQTVSIVLMFFLPTEGKGNQKNIYSREEWSTEKRNKIDSSKRKRRRKWSRKIREEEGQEQVEGLKLRLRRARQPDFVSYEQRQLIECNWCSVVWCAP